MKSILVLLCTGLVSAVAPSKGDGLYELDVSERLRQAVHQQSRGPLGSVASSRLFARKVPTKSKTGQLHELSGRSSAKAGLAANKASSNFQSFEANQAQKSKQAPKVKEAPEANIKNGRTSVAANATPVGTGKNNVNASGQGSGKEPPNYQKSTTSSRNKQVSKEADSSTAQKLCKRADNCKTTEGSGSQNSQRPPQRAAAVKAKEALQGIDRSDSSSEASSTTNEPVKKRPKLKLDTEAASRASSVGSNKLSGDKDPFTSPGISPTELIKNNGLRMAAGGPGQLEEHPKDQKSVEYSSKMQKLSRPSTNKELSDIGDRTAKTFVKDVHTNGDATAKSIGDVTVSEKSGFGKKNDGKERTYVGASTSRVRKETGVPPNTAPAMRPVHNLFKGGAETHGESGIHKALNEAQGLSPITEKGEMGRTMSFNVKNAKGDVNQVVPQRSCKDDQITNAACRYQDLGSAAGVVKDNRARIEQATDKPAEQQKILQETLDASKKKNDAASNAEAEIQRMAEMALKNKSKSVLQKRAVRFRSALRRALFRRCADELASLDCQFHSRKIVAQTARSLRSAHRQSAFVEIY